MICLRLGETPPAREKGKSMAVSNGFFEIPQGFKFPGFKAWSVRNPQPRKREISQGQTKKQEELDEHEIRVRCDAWSDLALYLPSSLPI